MINLLFKIPRVIFCCIVLSWLYDDTRVAMGFHTAVGLPPLPRSPLILLFSLFTTCLGYDYESYSRSNAIRIDSTRTLAGPLTTVFTPPASCFTPHTTAYYGLPMIVQGFDGPYGDDCSPDEWKYNRYFSPGQCPSGYKACTLPTETQRIVTTEICCPRLVSISLSYVRSLGRDRT